MEQIFRGYMDDESLSLLQYHKTFFKLDDTKGVSFNKNQRIVIVGYDISPEIRQTAVFLRKKGMTTTFLEFNYFKTASKEQLMSVDMVVGKEPVLKGGLKPGSRPPTDKKTFLGNLDESVRPVFEAIFGIAEKLQLPIHWGAVGFSLNVDLGGDHVALIMGYPRSSAYSQTIYTYVPSIIAKVEGGEHLADSFKENLTKTGLFKPAGNELKYTIGQKPTEEQINALIKVLADFAEQIQKANLSE